VIHHLEPRHLFPAGRHGQQIAPLDKARDQADPAVAVVLRSKPIGHVFAVEQDVRVRRRSGRCRFDANQDVAATDAIAAAGHGLDARGLRLRPEERVSRFAAQHRRHRDGHSQTDREPEQRAAQADGSGEKSHEYTPDATIVVIEQARGIGAHPPTGFWPRQEIIYDAHAIMSASAVREIDVAVVAEAVARLLIESNYRIPSDILDALREASGREQSVLGRRTLEQLIENYEVAAREELPVCQDSGVTVVMMEVGQDVHWVGGSLREAVFAGIRAGTARGYLRCSVVGDPIARRTLPTDAAGVVHIDLVEGAGVKLTAASKGFGAENMSALRMFTPADGIDAVKQFVVDTVDHAGANACPPVIVGVGIGGTFEVAALLAKKAALRPIDRRHPLAPVAAHERDLLDRINRLGIGPQGFGGLVTALAVNIEVYPTHIAGLPAAVNLACHSNRRVTSEL
jgi:fumarate hydratase subunit alpha